ncbi:hypothetical protein PAXRUDRAFT_13523 [Paxillus rubicundulus Ve08.2h10]|uniref:CxC1-like cysteine cluster associated with KDZ transposases domain-containing protein n=1 Tax=Paxillus rubicundulus Ve08.2h10 TaxID=930991 RepID=A0A0D0DYU6_9AGAM|nr:hypothetical protein PAXRUDRAFT_13523 [Paxillus rubicundulus Ve08.2h10]
MTPRAGTCAALPSTKTGLGQHFSSPHKVKDKQKTQTYVSIPLREHKHQRLLDHMEDLLNHKENLEDTQSTPLGDNQGLDHSPSVPHEAEGSEFHVEYNTPDDNNNIISTLAPASTGSSQPHLFNNWKTVIPTLVQPFIQYLTQTLGKPVNIPSSSISCCAQACELKQTMLVCLYFDYFAQVVVQMCKCASLPQVLLYYRLFPTAPSQPHMAVSVELLAFYRALFERSCNAVNALASALNSHYTCRGF